MEDEIKINDASIELGEFDGFNIWGMEESVFDKEGCKSVERIFTSEFRLGLMQLHYYHSEKPKLIEDRNKLVNQIRELLKDKEFGLGINALALLLIEGEINVYKDKIRDKENVLLCSKCKKEMLIFPGFFKAKEFLKLKKNQRKFYTFGWVIDDKNPLCPKCAEQELNK